MVKTLTALSVRTDLFWLIWSNMHSFSPTLSHTLLHFGLVGCMWSICGIHDQGWAERAVFGKIRYMNYKGCLRKFNVAQFERKYCPKSLWSTICLEGCVKSAQQRGSLTPWPQGHFFLVTAFLVFLFCSSQLVLFKTFALFLLASTLLLNIQTCSCIIKL